MTRSLKQDSTLRVAVTERLRFILEILIDTNPVTGQAELDNIQFPEVFAIFSKLDESTPVRPSETYVRQLWKELLHKQGIFVRLHKSVSKCDRCIQLRMCIRKVRISSPHHTLNMKRLLTSELARPL